MIKIYHNPKCSKSRQALEILESKTNDFELIEYIKTGLDRETISNLFDSLKDSDVSMIRVKDSSYKEDPFDIKDKELVIKRLSQSPILLERPIVSKEGKLFIIGRPPERILELF